MASDLRAALRALAALAGLGGAVAVTWFAASLSLKSDLPPSTVATANSVTVEQATVSRSLALSSEVDWAVVRSIASPASGTVTRFEPRANIDAGAIVAWIDEVPLTVAPGAIPMYRDLALRSRGQDVAQLQRLLLATGYLGVNDVIDGVFGSSTRKAVIAWEDSQGRPAPSDGVVGLNELVFVDGLPSRALFPDSVSVGSRIATGDPMVSLIAAAPTFTLKVDAGVVSELAAGQSASVRTPNGAIVRATVGPLVEDLETGQYASVLALARPCTAACTDLQQGQLVTTRIEVVEETTGPALPLSAIEDSPNGRTQVRLADGSTVEITVIATDRGIAIIEGVDVGDIVVFDLVPSQGS